MAKKSKQISYVKTCADCGSRKIRITDCREWGDGTFRRRRLCSDCGYEFYTLEVEESVSDLGGLQREIEILQKEKEELEERLSRIKDLVRTI